MKMQTLTPQNTEKLIEMANSLSGMTLGQLAMRFGWATPVQMRRAKGWAGQLVEAALGAQSGSLAQPDFPALGVELKTVPINAKGEAAQTTYVTVFNAGDTRWEATVAYHKLKKILWIPIEGEREIPLNARRIGKSILHSPSPEQWLALQNDWQEIMDIYINEGTERLTSQIGTYLHIRPKAANNAIRNTQGEAPKGYYLRKTWFNNL